MRTKQNLYLFISLGAPISVLGFTSLHNHFALDKRKGDIQSHVLHNALKVDFDDNDKGLTFDQDGPRIVFKAQKHHNVRIEELPGHRTLLEYLALPAEQYSVLDAGTIFKKDTQGAKNNEFTCVVEPVTFLGNTLEATIDAEVDVSPYPEGKSIIRVVGCTLDGSRLAKFANGSFDVNCTNVVRALRQDFKDEKDVPVLQVDCNLEISALVPREGRWLPKRLVGKSGSMVMQQLLNVLVPKFVVQLAADYDRWGAGDDSRSPVASEPQAGKSTLINGDDETPLLDQELIQQTTNNVIN